MKQQSKLLLGLACLITATVWIVIAVTSPKEGSLLKHSDGLGAFEDTELPMVASLITDPFFHPAIQTILPPSPPIDPSPRRLGGAMPSTEPLQPVLQGPLIAYPSPPTSPQALPGVLPNQTVPSQEGKDPELPVRISLQGVVVGDRPAAFLRLNDAPSIKAHAGTKIPNGITVLEISENEVTISRKGKTLTLRPGQAENL